MDDKTSNDETTTATPLENIYDEQIAPLMSQIIDICKRDQLPMFACFYLDPTEDGDLLKCSTLLSEDDSPKQAREEMAHCLAVVKQGARVKTSLESMMLAAYQAQLARDGAS